MAEEQDTPKPAGRSFLQKMKDAVKKIGSGIVSTLMWTGAWLGGSYFAGRFINKNLDIAGMGEAVDGKKPEEAVGAILNKAKWPLVISAALNGAMGFAGFGVTSPAEQTGNPMPPRVPVTNAQLGNNPQNMRNTGQRF